MEVPKSPFWGKGSDHAVGGQALCLSAIFVGTNKTHSGWLDAAIAANKNLQRAAM
jgi:hypothetical protein